jgi:6,7-dimethyl-8-ribityllumazine synthase
MTGQKGDRGSSTADAVRSPELKGSFDGKGVRVAVAVARFNDLITSRLQDGCREALRRYGVRDEDVTWAEVPGARELPVTCRSLAATGRFDAVIALGCVIRGETAHFEWVAGEASRGIGQAAVETGIPIIFGVLTTENLEQALDRAGGKAGNAGWNAAVSAIEMATLMDRIAKRDADAPG